MNAHIEQRDHAIAAAHTAIGDAMRHLNNATIHAREIDDWVHVDHLSGIIRQLSSAREPLAAHIDWLEQGRPKLA